MPPRQARGQPLHPVYVLCSADRFRTRAAEGRVRDGHGGLRLEHVYFEPAAAEPLVIDAIEFNARFREGDVAGDVAFLAMELDARR